MNTSKILQSYGRSEKKDKKEYDAELARISALLIKNAFNFFTEVINNEDIPLPAAVDKVNKKKKGDDKKRKNDERNDNASNAIRRLIVFTTKGKTMMIMKIMIMKRSLRNNLILVAIVLHPLLIDCLI